MDGSSLVVWWIRCFDLAREPNGRAVNEQHFSDSLTLVRSVVESRCVQEGQGEVAWSALWGDVDRVCKHLR